MNPAATPGAQQEIPVPDPVEILMIPMALTGVVELPDGQAGLFFQTQTGRRYQFALDEDGRKTIGGKLLAPRVHLPKA